MDARSARRIWIRIGIPLAQHPLMRKCEAFLSVLMLGGGVVARSQTTSAEAEIDKNSISVHRVRSGNMPLRLMPAGEIVSISPPELVVTVPAGTVPPPQVGQRASVQVTPPAVLTGSVVDIDRATLIDSWKLTVRLRDSFPAGVTAGTKAGSLIEVGELKDVVYFERPANARPHTATPLFVVDPEASVARRTSVRFGVQSGALIQILSGLSPGDLVIVTDTTKWNSYQLLRLR